MLLATSFVGLAVLLGWALRGQYGHQLGATIPGVLFSLALVLVSGRPDWMQRAPLIALAGGVGFAVGGSASYGILIGYTRARVWTNVLYGFFCLYFTRSCLYFTIQQELHIAEHHRSLHRLGPVTLIQ